MTPTIIRTRGQELILVSSPSLYTGSKRKNLVSFQLDKNWEDEVDIRVRFFKDKEEGNYLEETYNADGILIPEVLLAEKGNLFIGLVSLDEEKNTRLTSGLIKLSIKKGTPTPVGGSIVEQAKAEQLEKDRIELAKVLKELTGEELQDTNWDTLINKAKELPLKSAQDILNLASYSGLCYAFEKTSGMPSLFTAGAVLDKNEDGTPIYLKIPYIYTPNIALTINHYISNWVGECGFDLSGSPNFNTYNEKSMFSKADTAQNLQKLLLTGTEVAPYGANRFAKMPSLKELTLIEGTNYPDAYDFRYWRQHFWGCTKLEAILGTPLDMTRDTSYWQTFKNCYALKHVRFKPGTILYDLHFGDCTQLMNKYGALGETDPGTLLSIVNGVREYTGSESKITIVFNAAVKDFLTTWRCQKDLETGLYVSSEDGPTLATVLTNEKGVIIA